jgi:hypothetical protein
VVCSKVLLATIIGAFLTEAHGKTGTSALVLNSDTRRAKAMLSIPGTAIACQLHRLRIAKSLWQLQSSAFRTAQGFQQDMRVLVEHALQATLRE